jgi:CRISPR-associated protein Csb1
MTTEVTTDVLDRWATDMAGPVALHLKQKLLPVEGEGGVIFPPTYADIGYNVDTLSDGTRVVTIDSVGSQANRLEPIFKAAAGAKREDWLVPQIEIVLPPEDCGECDACRNAEAKKRREKCKNPHKAKRSIFDLAHRAADAVVQSSPGLRAHVDDAFRALHRNGDAGLLCELAPTSLVFGVWDSRGGTGEKRPRLVRSIIRAWDVEPLHAAAQFNSIWKALGEDEQEALESEAKSKKTKLSTKGLKDAPAVFRKTKIEKYVEGAPNPEARVLGGVIARERIEREVTVNLVALRGLRGKNDAETEQIRKYLLGLSLVAATVDIDLFLREGCHLRYAGDDAWHAVPRRGEPHPVNLAAARNVLQQYVDTAARHFRPKWQERWPTNGNLEYTFDLQEAKKLLAKATAEEQTDEE